MHFYNATKKLEIHEVCVHYNICEFFVIFLFLLSLFFPFELFYICSLGSQA
jgi:hypothetical protein